MGGNNPTWGWIELAPSWLRTQLSDRGGQAIDNNFPLTLGPWVPWDHRQTRLRTIDFDSVIDRRGRGWDR